MSLPPCLMRLKVYNAEHDVNLWLPIFLAWIILLVFAIALAPIVLILVAILWPFGWGRFLWQLGPTIYNCLCALRGLTVDTDKPNERVLIYFK